MRIAYIAPYQGNQLVQSRPSSRNLSLAARMKMGLIAELLQKSSHSVEILSQGEVIERQFKFYPAFSEGEASSPDIPVHYASAFPVKFLNGFWSSLSTLRLFKARHCQSPFHLVVIYNLKPPQVACADYALRRLGLPVILEYEDDAFSDVWGHGESGVMSKYYIAKAKRLLGSISACAATSPNLLAQAPASVPKLMLRGVVSKDIVNLSQQTDQARKNWAVFSGTHEGSQGLEQMIKAWQMARLPDWELHIAGQGPLTALLQKSAADDSSIIFHGLLNRAENARMLCSAKIGLNPQDITRIPGNTFPFKITEYLAAGLHVISTPRGTVEPELEAGISYLPDNRPETIATVMSKVILDRAFECTAARAALETYGPAAVSQSLERLIQEVLISKAGKNGFN